MNQQQFEGILRHALTLAGAVVLVFFSDAEGLVGEITASAMMLGGIVWSLVRKTGGETVDKVKGVVRHSFAIVSSFLLYFGKTDIDATVGIIVNAIINIIPFIWSFVDKSED